MHRISGNTVKMSRGDAWCIDFYIENYTFLETDVAKLAIFDENSTFEDALVTLTAEIDLENNKATFTINEDTTEFAEPLSKKKIYWFEVKLNGDQTVIGYDDDGPKQFIIYPAEVGDTNA